MKMNILKTVFWVLLVAVLFGVFCWVFDLGALGMPLGMLAGGLTVNWCIDKYDLIRL